MSQNESAGVQSSGRGSSDVELLLEQMTLRGPSDQLDVAIANLVASDGASEPEHVGAARFGWTAILTTAMAALLAGVLLGYFAMPTWKLLSQSSVAVGASSHDAGVLTPTSFNVHAFNLLHGHSLEAEFKNCDRCHQPVAAEGGGLSEVFQIWFYGDEHFFEVHSEGLSDCSKCHAWAPVEQDEISKDSPQKFARLMNCTACHNVDADGFGGFKKDWHSAASSSKG